LLLLLLVVVMVKLGGCGGDGNVMLKNLHISHHFSSAAGHGHRTPRSCFFKSCTHTMYTHTHAYIYIYIYIHINILYIHISISEWICLINKWMNNIHVKLFPYSHTVIEFCKRGVLEIYGAACKLGSGDSGVPVQGPKTSLWMPGLGAGVFMAVQGMLGILPRNANFNGEDD
jgi:hypothetical protein